MRRSDHQRCRTAVVSYVCSEIVFNDSDIQNAGTLFTLLHYHPALTDIERRGAFTGTRITLRQVSPESESIFDFIIELYKSTNGDWKAIQSKAGVSDEDLKYFLEYATQFLGNCGNYKGFGDSKFVPRCPEKAFDALAATSAKANEHYKATKGAIFSSDNEGIMHLGYLDENQ
jgi:dipeptidyl-peptidase-3